MIDLSCVVSGQAAKGAARVDVPQRRFHILPADIAHILAGGNGFTKTAQLKWDAHQAALSADNKALVYLPNGAIARLANEYKPEILSALKGPLGVEQQSPPENDA